MINKSPSGLSRSGGLTIIEILIVVSLAAILISFAIPSVGSAAARAELQAASENLQFSIEAARNTARMSESSVSLQVETLPIESAQRITFSSSTKRGRKSVDSRLQEYLVSEKILLKGTHDAFIFDKSGMVTDPGELTLVSRDDESLSITLQVR